MLNCNFMNKSGYYLEMYHSNYRDELIFASLYSYTTQIDSFLKKCASKQVLELSRWNKPVICDIDNYYVTRTSDASTGLSNVILLRKEVIDTDNKSFEYYILSEGEPSNSTFFDKINVATNIPLLNTWSDYLASTLKSSGQISKCNLTYYDSDTDREKQLWRCAGDDQMMLRIVTHGLQNQLIHIDENKVSSNLERSTRLDAYLAQFSDSLTTRIQDTFTPRFDPVKSTYSQSLLDFEDWCWNDGEGVQLFDAQKSVIEASARCLNKEGVAFIVGEMGTGKTIMGAGLTYMHGKQLGYNAIVMAPAHLVRKWAREIENSVPNAVCHVVSSVSDIIALDDEIKNKDKTYNLYMIMSYESAKFTYYEMPCPIYKEVYNFIDKSEGSRTYGQVIDTMRDVYVCPKCGQPLFYERTKGKGRRAKTETIYLNHEDFTKQDKYNLVCTNKVQIWDAKTNEKKIVTCNEALWRPISREEKMGDWVKLGALGWYRTTRIRALAAFLSSPSRINTLTKKQSDLLAKLQDAIDVLDRGEEIKIRPLIKYPLGKYIKRTYKNLIDYAVFDEIHKLSSDESLQGQAMGDLAQACRNTIGLTGTLINGYADSLFYILYRLIPRTMLSNGYSYQNTQAFLKEYGSSKTTVGSNNKKRNDKLPGVSPLLFTEYLLDICGFITLDDVADGLPGYTEIPIGVDLDPDVARSYEAIKSTFRNAVGYNGTHPKSVTNFMRLLSTYPDMPYGQAPIIDPETEEVVYIPDDNPNAIDTKLNETLDIVDQKIANGERVLIYYSWVNTTNVADELETALAARGYNVSILKTDTTKNVDREAWVEEQVANGIDVLLCNPALVETGLDLLDFTTIIFYQLGYSVFTMRQASRRSWRLGQTRDIEVYFMYYKETIQEDVLALMASKLQASMAAEGRLSEEGLSAMSRNDDLTTQVTNSVMKGIGNRVDISSFNTTKKVMNGERLIVATENRRRSSREKLRYKKPYIARWYKFNHTQARKAESSQTIFNLIKTPLANLNLFA